MKLHPDNARRINELLEKAKSQLMEARSIVRTDAKATPRMIKKLGMLAGETEVLQRQARGAA